MYGLIFAFEKQKGVMIVIIASVLAIGLIIFLIYQNMKDEKKFEKDLNEKEEHPSRPPVEGGEFI